MSRHKIKKPRAKAFEKNEISSSPRGALKVQIQMERDRKKQVETEMVEKRIDLERRHDYRYIAAKAEELGMTTGRLNKIVDRLVNKRRRVEQKRRQVAGE